MKQTRKGNAWYFGMKVHIGTDVKGRVHTLTAAHDVTVLPELLRGEERILYGDKDYWKEADRQDAEAHGSKYRVNRRGTEQHPVDERWKAINRAPSRVRAHVEHPFLL